MVFNKLCEYDEHLKYDMADTTSQWWIDWVNVIYGEYMENVSWKFFY